YTMNTRRRDSRSTARCRHGLANTRFEAAAEAAAWAVTAAVTPACHACPTVTPVEANMAARAAATRTASRQHVGLKFPCGHVAGDRAVAGRTRSTAGRLGGVPPVQCHRTRD